MKKYKTRQARVLVDILCDVCGKSCKNEFNAVLGDDDEQLDEAGDFEYGTVSASWGYSSRKDGVSYSATLCETCFDDVVKHINNLRTQRTPSE